jgi:hypothetical protein
VTRLRAACTEQLGKDFAGVHAFLRSVRCRESEHAATTAAAATAAAVSTLSSVSPLSDSSALSSLPGDADGNSPVVIDIAAAAGGVFRSDEGVDSGLLSEAEVTSCLLSLVRVGWCAVITAVCRV